MNNELRACPFCGQKCARVRRFKWPTLVAHTVQCACGAKVANYDTHRAAVDAWNGCMLRKTAQGNP